MRAAASTSQTLGCFLERGLGYETTVQNFAAGSRLLCRLSARVMPQRNIQSVFAANINLGEGDRSCEHTYRNKDQISR